MTSLWKPVGLGAATTCAAAVAGTGVYAALEGKDTTTKAFGAVGAALGSVAAVAAGTATCRAAIAYRAKSAANVRLPQEKSAKLPADASVERVSSSYSSSDSQNQLTAVCAMVSSMGGG